MHEEEPPLTEAEVDMPRDYATAIPRIESYRNGIRDAVLGGHPHDAHRHLDEAEFVLRKLIVIARDSDVPREEWENVNVNARSLRVLFNQIHAQIDADQPADYASLAADIDAAIERLTRVAHQASTPAEK